MPTRPAPRSGDVAEAHAINRAIGNSAAVYAPKSALGHSVGAAGAVESILTMLTLRDGIIPPTLNFANLDPEVDLDVVAGNPARRLPVRRQQLLRIRWPQRRAGLRKVLSRRESRYAAAGFSRTTATP